MTFDQASRIGFIGLGVMGSGMAHCLLRAGFSLTVYARRDDAAAPLVAGGAKRAATPAALARESDLVIVCVSDAPAVEEVLFGADGAAQGLARGSCVIDTSTIAASSAREIGKRLAQQGVAFLDSPVSGGQQGAEAGTLAAMVGGDAQVLEACRGVMSAFCKTITHVGAQGAGQAVKSCNQVAVTAAMLGVAEAMALARSQGVDLAVMREVVLGGTGRSFAMDRHGQRVIDGSYTPGFRTKLMRKDLRIALDTARAAGASLPGTALVEGLLDAMCASGQGEVDWCAIALEVQRRSGMDVPGT